MKEQSVRVIEYVQVLSSPFKVQGVNDFKYMIKRVEVKLNGWNGINFEINDPTKLAQLVQSSMQHDIFWYSYIWNFEFMWKQK